MTVDILFRGQQGNLFIVGYVNGAIRIYTSD